MRRGAGSSPSGAVSVGFTGALAALVIGLVVIALGVVGVLGGLVLIWIGVHFLP